MLTIKRLMELVQPGNWFTTTDLKDNYFHIEVVTIHRKCLRFVLQGISYKYNRLPFGYSLAPHTFSQYVDVVPLGVRPDLASVQGVLSEPKWTTF